MKRWGSFEVESREREGVKEGANLSIEGMR